MSGPIVEDRCPSSLPCSGNRRAGSSVQGQGGRGPHRGVETQTFGTPCPSKRECFDRRGDAGRQPTSQPSFRSLGRSSSSKRQQGRGWVPKRGQSQVNAALDETSKTGNTHLVCQGLSFAGSVPAASGRARQGAQCNHNALSNPRQGCAPLRRRLHCPCGLRL